jgi:integral membrane sensor domain MASE1
MKKTQRLHKKHQFRMMLCGHKAVEAGAACLILMVQGQLAQATATHFIIASETGLLTVFPLLGITWTRHARHYTNRWMSALFVGVCTFIADALIHHSHYAGEYTEAGLTALAAAALSLIVSFTPLGRHIDHLAETFR